MTGAITQAERVARRREAGAAVWLLGPASLLMLLMLLLLHSLLKNKKKMTQFVRSMITKASCIQNLYMKITLINTLMKQKKLTKLLSLSFCMLLR